jgi:hypothetical protein
MWLVACLCAVSVNMLVIYTKRDYDFVKQPIAYHDFPEELGNLTAQDMRVKLQLGREQNQIYFFTMRDARRLAPNQLPEGIHIFDYVDIYAMQQSSSKQHALFLDGENVGIANCQKYNLECYKHKILQVFLEALNATKANYFFYMEADNDLCVPFQKIHDFALKHQRYFVSCGVGTSGWIMSRQFMIDFVARYGSNNRLLGPDVEASFMLMKMKKWSVTRQYWVSHSILPAIGADGLTLKNSAQRYAKHLPRCLEPHRGLWPTKPGSKNDMFGWDYFDFDECPKAELFPCEKSQMRASVAVVLPMEISINAKDEPPTEISTNAKDEPHSVDTVTTLLGHEDDDDDDDVARNNTINATAQSGNVRNVNSRTQFRQRRKERIQRIINNHK